jgi:hypothetical protein
MTSLIQSIEARYGVGVYDPKKTPAVIPFPQAKPLYNGMADVDFVEEHGEWCRSKMIGGEAAEKLPIPAASIPLYADNERRLDDILAAHRAR